MPTKTPSITHELKRKLGKNPSTKAKKLLAYAYEKNLKPVMAPKGETKLPIRFNEEETHLYRRGDESYKGAYVVGMILAALNEQSGQRAIKCINTLSFTDGRQLWDNQQRIIKQMQKALAENNIIAVEASTGSGKSASLIATGILDGRKIVVAAPSIKIIHQLVEEYRSFNVAHDYSVVLGKQAFISETLLMEALPDVDESLQNEIKQWIYSAKNAESTSLFKHSWLAEECAEACPSLPSGLLSAVTLNNIDTSDAAELDGDGGFREWSIECAQVLKRSPQFIFCTHTMLAIDLLRRLMETKKRDDSFSVSSQDYQSKTAEEQITLLQKIAGERGASSEGIFGNRVLLVDEAHLLETNLANFFNDSLSLFSIVQLFKRADCPGLEDIKSAFNEFVRIGRLKQSNGENKVQPFSPEMKAIENFTQCITKSFAKIKNKKNSTYTTLKNAIAIFSAISKNKQRSKETYLSFTTSYNYPRIVFGRKHLALEMGVLWGGFRAAALVSATLSVPEKGYSYVSQTLFIPAGRFVQGEAVKSPWLHTNITLHLPQEPAPFLCRPDGNKTIDEWINDLAITLDYVAEGAQGGVLVLCSSYEIINMLTNSVNAETYSRLITQSPITPFRKHENKFRLSKRPVWLAVGQAWTGLNLKSNDNPHLLTDLIIPTIPFGMKRTVSHIRRIAKWGFEQIEPFEAAIQLKQGIGRLKREDDNVQRHLWVLDNRAIAGAKANLKHYRVPMKVLEDYTTRKPILKSHLSV